MLVKTRTEIPVFSRWSEAGYKEVTSQGRATPIGIIWGNKGLAQRHVDS